MISKADAIVIGSGGLGAATAYYLSQRKRLSIALIDKHDIGSQTSPRAAGMVSCARKSDLMISLIKDACRKIEAFREETGQPLDWVHSGSLKIARRPQDAEIINADFERGRRMRLDVELCRLCYRRVPSLTRQAIFAHRPLPHYRLREQLRTH